MITVDNLLKKHGIQTTTENVVKVWTQPWRYYHTLENHLEPMMLKIENFGLDLVDFEILTIAAIFHDWVYKPWDIKLEIPMEESSIKYLDKIWKRGKGFDISEQVYNIIRSTETLKPKTKLERMFVDIDVSYLRGHLSSLIKSERLIFKEYQFANYSQYKENRIKFLKDNLELGGDVMSNSIPALIEIIENKIPRIGVYAGSFNPFHKGHLNILEKSERMFDKVIIAKGKNDNKKVDDFIFNRELESLKETLKWREVIMYDGLLTDYIKSQKGDITLIRGLRNGYDLESENKLMFYMTKMYPKLKVIYIPCDKEYEYISSTDIRAIKNYGDFANQFLP